AELKYPKEVVKAMSLGDLDKLVKQSTFYKDTFGMGREEGREEDIRSVLATRFGSVSDRLSRCIHTIREKNASLLGDLIKLAVTVKDLGEFERRLDELR
ncbi:MAG: hypothetical protein U9N09_06230, partial [Euryarchaeota archaeon]|nr:hypothetical protein [Euryarchaeota archaeon]